MAHVSPSTRADLDHLLERALAAWEGLPEVEREIDAWDLVDQLVFVEEWPIEDERLRQLAAHSARGELTHEQLAHYQPRLPLVERHRPIVERLRAS